MHYTEENLAKVTFFDQGPIEAIGYQLCTMVAQSGERPGDIVIVTRAGARSNPTTEAKLTGPLSPYGVYAITISGNYDGPASHHIPLDYDVRPERQLRKIVDKLENDFLLTPGQKHKAYEELGLEDTSFYQALGSRRLSAMKPHP